MPTKTNTLTSTNIQWPNMLLALRLCALLCCLSVWAQTTYADTTDSPQRVIVKWKTTNRTQALSIHTPMPPAPIRMTHGVTALALHEIGTRTEVLHFDRTLTDTELSTTLEDLRQRDDVEYAIIDQRVYPLTTVTNDPFLVATTGRTGQWYLQADPAQPSAIDAIDAWDITHGSSNVIVAVLDTGIRFDHPDLTNKLLPGYDFVSEDAPGKFVTANDGNGRDDDPSDPGDWVSSADLALNIVPSSCKGPVNSSWHGTRVAGIIAAETDNNMGIAGTGWNTHILPVRVLGKCSGYESDIVAAIRWAAGIHVTGVPDNSTPAQIINLSLGSISPCTAAYRDAINEVTARGVVVIAAAGNDGNDVDAPANCDGVIAVAGLRHEGDKVGYSNLGTKIALAAPAGNCVNTAGAPCLFSIETTFNTGITVPAGNSYTTQLADANYGTSFSAPIVAGIAALMLAVNPNLTPTAIRERLQSSASPFPQVTNTTCQVPTSSSGAQAKQCNCTTSTCGAGMANAYQAVLAAANPIINLIAANRVEIGTTTLLDASTSAAADDSPLSFTWSVLSGNATLSNTNQTTTTLTAPTTAGTTTIRLTVTDAANNSSTQDTEIAINNPPPRSKKGGGTFNIIDLYMLVLLGMLTRRRLVRPGA